MVERKTIRPEASLHGRLNTERKDLGLSWDDYLELLYEDRSLTVTISPEQADEIGKRAGRHAADRLREELGR